jgi:hypothetical protein
MSTKKIMIVIVLNSFISCSFYLLFKKELGFSGSDFLTIIFTLPYFGFLSGILIFGIVARKEIFLKKLLLFLIGSLTLLLLVPRQFVMEIANKNIFSAVYVFLGVGWFYFIMPYFIGGLISGSIISFAQYLFRKIKGKINHNSF